MDFTEPEPVDRANVEVGGRFFIIPTFNDYGSAGGYGNAAPALADPSAADPAATTGRTRQARAKREKVSDGTVKAPMQGTIIKINAARRAEGGQGRRAVRPGSHEDGEPHRRTGLRSGR